MKLRFLTLLALSTTLSLAARETTLRGTVVDASTGRPVAGATVMLEEQGVVVTTDPNGVFLLTADAPGSGGLTIFAFGYDDLVAPVTLLEGNELDLGALKLSSGEDAFKYSDEMQELAFDQSLLDGEEGNAQSIGALTGASDNIYYNATNYDFSVMRFRFRGYNSEYNTTYINGLPFNDLARGRFNYSTLGGMNRAFRNRTNTVGMDAAEYGFGDIGGSANISTITSEYAPGFYGSLAYTNSNYMFRAMAQYSTGISDRGWGATVAAVGRYADEGVIPGTFYNSGGLFLSVEKQFSPAHSLVFTFFGAPTQRATASATFLEAYELADNNLYNPNWGWQDGKKRSAKIVESFDPTFMMNWLFKPSRNTSLNTGAAVRWIHYSTSALNWYNAADPRPDYYRYLPSYFKEKSQAFDEYTDLWRNDEAFRQIKWDNLYEANYLNNYQNANGTNATPKGSTYILENRHSNQFNAIFNTLLNHRISSTMSLQAGASFNFTRAHYFKTIRDLLGGEFWLDVDQFAERDYPSNPNLAINDLNNPYRKVVKGDRFGYDYYINALQARLWLQNMIHTSHWDVHYGLSASYTQFFRDGKMRNGRAPGNSYGNGLTHRFDNMGIKAGAVYKLNGRNYFMANAEYETRAPLFEYAYVSPRTKDTTVDLNNERILSVDASYGWSYSRFRGSIGGFFTQMSDQTERTSFYDDNMGTFVNYVLKGVRTNYKGIELGMAFKITPSLTASFAGTIASYRYKNNPQGIRSVENGQVADTATVVYLKNYRVGGTPQTAANIGIDWAAPHSWFFNINASWMSDAYVNLSPIRHESMENLWARFSDPGELEAKRREIACQEKLNDAFVLNASIGKVLYINRKLSMNFNLNVDNILNRKNIMTYGYQQGRFDYTNFDSTKYPSKYYFAQGIKVYFNVGVRF
ncbi:MAG: TonB-dependent receptor [Clostridium sp.]|nr:TonB-dependent receptor [Clostridium sp.]